MVSKIKNLIYEKAASRCCLPCALPHFRKSEISDRTMKPNDLSDKEIIANAKKWYENVKQSQPKELKLEISKNHLSAANSQPVAPGTPNWTLAAVVKAPEGISLTTVPYDNSSSLQTTKNGYRNLLIYTDQSGTQRGVWLEVDSDVPSSNGKYNISTFTGKLLLFDLNNSFILGERYTNGSFAARIIHGTYQQYQTAQKTNNLLGHLIVSSSKPMVSGPNIARKKIKTDQLSVTYSELTCVTYYWYTHSSIFDAATGITITSDWNYDGSTTTCTSGGSLYYPLGAPGGNNNGFGGYDGFGTTNPQAHRVASNSTLPPMQTVFVGFVKGSGAILNKVFNLDAFWLIPCKTLAAFKILATFFPTQQVKDKLMADAHIDPSIWNSSFFFPQTVFNAAGYNVNMDYFHTKVTLPKGTTADQLLRYIRLNINTLIYPTTAKFSPYNDGTVNDTNLWNSSDPTGALIHIDIPAQPIFHVLHDDGTVVVTQTANAFTFTTTWSNLDNYHPVSRNRQIGYQANSDATYTFYATGIDRVTLPIFNIINILTDVTFAGGDKLWNSFLLGLNNYVASIHGSTSSTANTISRPTWSAVFDYLNGKSSLQTLQAWGGCDGTI